MLIEGSRKAFACPLGDHRSLANRMIVLWYMWKAWPNALVPSVELRDPEVR